MSDVQSSNNMSMTLIGKATHEEQKKYPGKFTSTLFQAVKNNELEQEGSGGYVEKNVERLGCVCITIHQVERKKEEDGLQHEQPNK